MDNFVLIFTLDFYDNILVMNLINIVRRLSGWFLILKMGNCKKYISYKKVRVRRLIRERKVFLEKSEGFRGVGV